MTPLETFLIAALAGLGGFTGKFVLDRFKESREDNQAKDRRIERLLDEGKKRDAAMDKLTGSMADLIALVKGLTP